MNDEYKTIRVSMPTYGYLMDRKSLKLKSVDVVIWDMVSVIEAQKKRIKELESAIEQE